MNKQTGVVTVNHNNKPNNVNFNSTYEFYMVAFTRGNKIGFTKLTFNFVYLEVNKPPNFTTPLPKQYSLTVREAEQLRGYFDPLVEFNTPVIKDPEGNIIIIDATLNKEFPCKCVQVVVEKKGSRTLVKVIVNRSKVTVKDQISNTALINI